jgi:hypothetical protein
MIFKFLEIIYFLTIIPNINALFAQTFFYYIFLVPTRIIYNQTLILLLNGLII